MDPKTKPFELVVPYSGARFSGCVVPYSDVHYSLRPRLCKHQKRIMLDVNFEEIEIQLKFNEACPIWYLILRHMSHNHSKLSWREANLPPLTEFKATEKSYPLAKHLVGGASLRTRTSFELRLANHIQICQKSRRIGCVTHLRNMLSEVLLTSASPDLRDLESNLRGFHWGSLPLVNKWILNYGSYRIWWLLDSVTYRI